MKYKTLTIETNSININTKIEILTEITTNSNLI